MFILSILWINDDIVQFLEPLITNARQWGHYEDIMHGLFQTQKLLSAADKVL